MEEIYYFNNDNNGEDNQESSNGNYNDDLENYEGYSNNPNNNPENNEGSNNNPNGNPNPNPNPEDDDKDDPVNIDAVEVQDPDYNGPEQIMDDLDMVDRARKNDPEALEYLKEEYGSFFDDTSTKEAVDDIEGYLEEEFPLELQRSEEEADAIEAREIAEREARAKAQRESEENNSKRPISEEEEKDNNKRQKSNNDDGGDDDAVAEVEAEVGL